MFAFRAADAHSAVFDQAIPTGKHGARHHARLTQTLRRSLDNLKCNNRGVADTLDLGQFFRWCSQSVGEATELTQLAFHLADQWRHPVVIYGDYLIAHTAEAVQIEKINFGPLPDKDWAVDGSLGGTGRSRNVNPIGMEKGSKGIDPNKFWQKLSDKEDRIQEAEQRFEVEQAEDAELLIVAFGTLARFARAAIRDLRADGLKVGLFRPISLWPFPAQALRDAASGCKRVAVLEQNAGQMIDDVQLSLLGSVPVVAIGGISTDAAGFGIGALLDSDRIAARARDAYAGKPVPRGVVS